MKVSFVIPYTPIPRINKRIEVAEKIFKVDLLYWDRGDSKKTAIKDYSPETKITAHSINLDKGSIFHRLVKSLSFSRLALKHLKKEKPEIIYTTKTDMLFLVYIYCLFTKIKPKVIYEVSDLHKYALNDSKKITSTILRKLIYCLEKISFKSVDKLVVTSPFFWDYYYKSLISQNHVVFLPNSPNEKIFKDYHAVRSEKFTIGFIGKIRYKKQLKMLIEVSNRVNIDVFIAGNGPDYEELKTFSKDRNNITFFGPYKYNSDIAKLYSKCDAIYSVYDTDIENVKIALPNRLYEAALCGIPLIVSRNTYLESVIIENGLGMAVNPYNPNQLEETILKLKNKQVLNSIKENGMLFYKKNSNSIAEKKLLNTFKKLI
ncbi:glycosyltransferase family 4 protein [Ruoffia sp. FAM 26254]|uniref:glycosyltransferase family 4 protein n=1 Tax=Ruoffia sp. FAM 26254 TaxID=3259518 RepID=UPI00388B541D